MVRRVDRDGRFALHAGQLGDVDVALRHAGCRRGDRLHAAFARRAAIRNRGRVGVVFRLDGQRAGDAGAVAGDDRQPIRNRGLGVRSNDAHGGSARHFHAAALRVGRRLAVGAARGARARAGGARALVGILLLVMNLVVEPAALVLAIAGGRLILVAAGDARLRLRPVGGRRARRKRQRAAGGDVALGAGDDAVRADRQRERDANARVARLGIARRHGLGRALVRGARFERACELELTARERAELRVRVVVRHRDRDHWRHRSGAARAAVGVRRHRVRRARRKLDVVRVGDLRVRADQRVGVGLADVEDE